ncbi:MAG: flagellar biosynthesis protein FlhA [Planctomycetaceae bacterium]
MTSHTTPPPRANGLQHSETVLAAALFVAIGVMLVPLPPLLLDLLLGLNLGLSIMLLLATLSARKATELSVFPALLLILTLFRLSLNVATTRLILLSGSAGGIVSAFGHLVVGGNVVVGMVIFLILVVIQFVVITKGAGRISEVSARFTLDALPGKQLAIDAELNAGVIDEAEARRRRKQLATETEFYGAMDGASKFVRGDAIAGLIITAINLVGGIILGVLHGLSITESITAYSILTIGDGLVSQLPALVIATTAGILTTKANTEDHLGDEIGRQLFDNDRPLWVAIGILGLMTLLPGVPRLPVFGLVGAASAVLWRRRQPAAMPGSESPAPPEAETPPVWDEARQLRDFLLTDRAIVEVGAGLASLINQRRSKSLPERITQLRREFSQTRGVWVPPIRVRANLELDSNSYRILLAGRDIASGTLHGDRQLAILPEQRKLSLPGIPTVEPVFKLPAVWIDPAIARQAENQGCTVVDPGSVLLTHLGEVLQQHGHELLTRETLKQMLDAVREFAPTVVDEIKTESLRMGLVHQVLVQLAEDRIPLADLSLILEAILNHVPHKKSADELVDAVRVDLGSLLCSAYLDTEGGLRVAALHPQLESKLREGLQADGQLAIPPAPLEALIDHLSAAWREARAESRPLALLTHHALRRPLRRLLRRAMPGLGFIAYREIPSDARIAPMVLLRLDEIFPDATATTASPLNTPSRTAA